MVTCRMFTIYLGAIYLGAIYFGQSLKRRDVGTARWVATPRRFHDRFRCWRKEYIGKKTPHAILRSCLHLEIHVHSSLHAEMFHSFFITSSSSSSRSWQACPEIEIESPPQRSIIADSIERTKARHYEAGAMESWAQGTTIAVVRTRPNIQS